MGRRRRRLPREPFEIAITGLSHEGRGIAHHDERTLFVHGALPGERVRAVYTKRRRSVAEARVVEVVSPAPERIAPHCPHFGVCGGCSLQHLTPERQVELKQSVLMEQFHHMGGVQPERVLAPLTGAPWGYRRKARLAVKHVPRKGGVLVGFREKHSPFVAEMDRCPVLDPRVGERLTELGRLIEGLSIPDRVPQIEVALGDETGALVFRNLAPLTAADLNRLAGFARDSGLAVYQQPGNEATMALVHDPVGRRLDYALPGHGVRLGFRPGDFTQVNAEINRAMVDQALDLLAVEPGQRVLDLFCGLGNFTLPLARRASEVVGVEGAEALVERGRENALRNGLDNVRFYGADLTLAAADQPWATGGFDRVLLDPPRSGAFEVLGLVAALGPKRIVYVSCGPATLARDAGELVHRHGYRLTAAGVMDMFPHTAHVESMAVFQREAQD
ncbi:23S rRNA (uracil(1939)-C(5))-methyltransferase RlmD [Alkalilimnicola ehrlichii MLHE-1]|uniref:23S rRNA (uracil(1939)-C(5))-methyltransferase RlmD n=1 Tax=Alkalilimnicola ehrlichii (strain ATCC BAA-1101 / DSM 17681 / MLHE-1) TaxID=187272 RepID=RLMD_ALKEH|nr:23S rRNA (uracil(1939)-C(5))-methyltransferase RlmD [Alkalilimnicola ehrlichii]Q0A8Y4.1 RecName: Full=23S rRNA (uracil(1939)-C(5))-methyltransferase RlmD; AltName: Full=23S rRNA(m5U1939)-methyltransferase [Alkalilimnicola ehrlichii MLHE-1]ABI56703.1 23S rRNA m(5)U-1939 methyltransferase [Alkalilimnicola ehrlichii MLHE-1]